MMLTALAHVFINTKDVVSISAPAFGAFTKLFGGKTTFQELTLSQSLTCWNIAQRRDSQKPLRFSA